MSKRRKPIIPLFLVLFWMSGLDGFAQQNISGSIVDQAGQPVPYANILAFTSVDTLFLSGTTSNDEGLFLLSLVDDFKGMLKVTSIGYLEQIITFEKSHEGRFNVKLEATGYQLDNVVVTARKKIFEQRVDRLVVNVAGIPSMSGNSALDILKKSPGVIVMENQESISLNSKGEVLVLINDRVTRMPMNTLINRLRSIQAGNIDRIEIIHQPPAKYDAAGSAGIINVVLKKIEMEGFHGDVNLMAGYGEDWTNSGGINMNYRNNKLNLYGNISGSKAKTPLFNFESNRSYEYMGNQYFSHNNVSAKDRNFYSGTINLGLDYQIDENTIIGGLFEYSKSFDHNNRIDNKSVSKINGGSEEPLFYESEGHNINPHQLANLNFNKKFNARTSLNVDGDRIKNIYTNDFTLRDINTSTNFEESNISRRTDVELYSVKADYEFKNDEDFGFQAGSKIVANNLEIQSRVREKNDGVFTEPIKYGAGNSYIDENLLAVYASISRSFNMLEGNIGLRYERYDYQLRSPEENDKVLYNNLFPTIHLKYDIDSIRSVTTAFNRRTNRAYYILAFGFINLSNPNTLTTSNPTIRPSFTTSLKVSYQQQSVLISLEGYHTKDAIEWYNRVNRESGFQTSNLINFNEMQGVILQTNFPIQIAKVWESNWNMNLSYNKLNDTRPDQLPFTYDIFTFSVQTNHLFNINDYWTANTSAMYLSPYIGGDQVKEKGFSLSVGIRKEFTNGSRLALSIDDITKTGAIWDWESVRPDVGFRTFGKTNFSDRVFRLTYSFAFGSNKIKGRRERSTAAEEENNRM